MMLLTRRQQPPIPVTNPADGRQTKAQEKEQKAARTRYFLTIVAAFLLMVGFVTSRQQVSSDAQVTTGLRTTVKSPSNAIAQGTVIVAETTAPSRYPRFQCMTTKGEFEVELYPHLAPLGVKRIISLVESGLFNETIPFFRVTENIAQFGAYERGIKDKKYDNLLKTLQGQDPHPYGGEGSDPVSVKKRKEHNWEEGTWASIGGPQQLVVLKANKQMGTSRHDAPAGKVVKGFESVFKRLYNKYNDIINHPKRGPGPSQVGVMKEGMKYIEKEFPLVDHIKWCVML